MGAVFELLHQNGTKKPEILELMANLKFTPNMQRLLEEAVDNLEATIIIISDSNSEFIHHILKEYKLSERVDKVFTNPARWTEIIVRSEIVVLAWSHHVYRRLNCLADV